MAFNCSSNCRCISGGKSSTLAAVAWSMIGCGWSVRCCCPASSLDVFCWFPGSISFFRRSFSIRFCRRFSNSTWAHSRFSAVSSGPKSFVARLLTRHRRSLSLSEKQSAHQMRSIAVYCTKSKAAYTYFVLRLKVATSSCALDLTLGYCLALHDRYFAEVALQLDAAIAVNAVAAAAVADVVALMLPLPPLQPLRWDCCVRVIRGPGCWQQPALPLAVAAGMAQTPKWTVWDYQ